MAAMLAQKLEMEESEKSRHQEEQDMAYAKNLMVSVSLIYFYYSATCGSKSLQFIRVRLSVCLSVCQSPSVRLSVCLSVRWVKDLTGSRVSSGLPYLFDWRWMRFSHKSP